MKMTRVMMVAVVIMLLLSSISLAEVKLSGIFNDNMVLQRDMKVPIWGWADPGEKITVTFAGRSATAVADAKGNWKVKIGPLKANSTPAEMTITGVVETTRGNVVFREVTTTENSTTLKNILVGEVWLCSGQSNVNWAVWRCLNAEAEMTDANNYPNIRMFKMVNISSAKPRKDIGGKWRVCDYNASKIFSGMGYFFGRELHKELKVPVGMIEAGWGGTLVESWTSREALDSVPFMKKVAATRDNIGKNYDPKAAQKDYEQRLAKWRKDVATIKAANAKLKAGEKPKPLPRNPWKPRDQRKSPHRPASLFNGMIHPLIPLAIRGVAWYQGETNEKWAYQYRTAFPLLINDWRKQWGQGDFPFLFVELANYRAVQTTPIVADDRWAFVREAQIMALSLPNTAIASAIDLGDPGEPFNIHPRNKQDVGKRLALAARAIAYGQKLVYSGPIYKAGSMKINGTKASLKFDHIGSGLVARGKEIKGFIIAGADKKWFWAKATIKGDTVIVSSPDVSAPVAVRYAWADNPACNLYNKENLPASTFRTDDWEGNYGPKD